MDHLADPTLALAADVLDDLEKVRIANNNRLSILTRTEDDEDGVLRGLGLDERHPDVANLAALVGMLEEAEKSATKNLTKILRRHPLHPWISVQRGAGDKQVARLLAAIGDPYLNLQTLQPRSVSQLWSYCGHGDPLRKKTKGMTQEQAFALGSPVAKKRVWGIAQSMVKAGVRKTEGAPLAFDPDTREGISEWGNVYINRRAETMTRVHTVACVRCGPSGKPAQPGTPWGGNHQVADALRIVGKEFLRDLWVEAKRLHTEGL